MGGGGARGRDARRSSARRTSGTVLEEVCGHVERVHEVPPGVDVELWRPGGARRRARRAARRGGSRRAEPRQRARSGYPDDGNAARLEAFLAGDRPTVVYFGKLIPQKGVDVLLDALAGLDARVVVVGFGPERAALEAQAR